MAVKHNNPVCFLGCGDQDGGRLVRVSACIFQHQVFCFVVFLFLLLIASHTLVIKVKQLTQRVV
jgi:hypothetical protein